jgi:hypothetical protein
VAAKGHWGVLGEDEPGAQSPDGWPCGRPPGVIEKIRSDNDESLRLGEDVALAMLAEQKACHNQRFSFTLTTFSGQKITL